MGSIQQENREPFHAAVLLCLHWNESSLWWECSINNILLMYNVVGAGVATKCGGLNISHWISYFLTTTFYFKQTVKNAIVCE